MTVEQLERLPEIDGISYELDQGELVEVPSPTLEHNLNRDQILMLVKLHLKTHPGQGLVVAEQPFRLSADTVRIPDVALIGPEQVAAAKAAPGILPFAPKLVIEVISPSNTVEEMAHRIRQYLEAGVRTIWILVGAMTEVHVYSAAARPKILSAQDNLEEPELLPGFSVPVAELFEV